MSATLDLCRELIRRASVSPDDQGCQQVLAERLQQLGFEVEAMPFGPVSNLWARRGSAAPLFCFAGHTDVVPAGDTAAWQSEPFNPEIRDGLLFGRGAADMKGSLAAMLVACESFIKLYPEHQGSIAFLITSDEEADAVDGTVKVMQRLQERGEQIDYCLVGEPSSNKVLGDTVRNGRRGSLNGKLRVIGQEGHVAYPELAHNPIHAFLPALAELVQYEWDQGNAHFPATSLQIADIHAGNGVSNVIPGELSALLNFRFSTEVTAAQLQTITEDIFARHYDNYELQWHLSGDPFITEEGILTEAVKNSIRAVNGVDCQLSTGGGTSDGRFIAPSGAQVVELGPCNASIHKNNEHVSVDELEQLTLMYERILQELLGN